MPVYSLTRDYHEMPDVRTGTRSGLVAVSLDIHPERVLAGYRAGMFPWFQNYDGLFHWYSPNPRSVLYPQNLIVHKSMRSIFNQKKFEYTYDQNFLEVVECCRSTPRGGANGEASSWLNAHFMRTYYQLHQRGLCHSVEVWQDGEIVGGLYGISLGKIFFGESMFSRVTNASKAGFITLVHTLQKAGFTLIDCQQDSPHLRTLGSTPISVDEYLKHLRDNAYHDTQAGHWRYNAEEKALEIIPLSVDATQFPHLAESVTNK